MLAIHPPAATPSLADRADISNTPTHRVNFYHPAYPPGEDRLLHLAAFDHQDGGLQHVVALDCLTIIAANAVGGYLARTRNGPAIDVPRYAVLMETDYFFIVPNPAGDGGGDPDEPYKYPVCPSFTEWRFPHDRFTPEWSSQAIRGKPPARKPPSGFTEKVLLRDDACVVTGHKTSVQACHLCPRSECDWFWRNDMGRYNLEYITRSDYALDDAANAITLRSDLHQEFDAFGFVLLRKSESGYVIHCLSATPDILPAYHNRQTRPLTTVAPQFLYVRLAYSIFPLLSAFLGCGESPKRIIRSEVGASKEAEIVDISPEEFRKPPSKSRSATPRKRSRPGSVMEDHNSYAQEPHFNRYQTIIGKRKRRSASTSSRSTSVSRFSEKEYQEDFRQLPPWFPNMPASGSSHDSYTDPNITDPTRSRFRPDVPGHKLYRGARHYNRLKHAWIKHQRPEGYVPPETEYNQGLGSTLPLGDEWRKDFEGGSLLGDWDEAAEKVELHEGFECENKRASLEEASV